MTISRRWAQTGPKEAIWEGNVTRHARGPGGARSGVGKGEPRGQDSEKEILLARGH